MDTDFANALARCLQRIPRGRAATYGVIAKALGDVRAARAVATWLHDYPSTAMAHRAVRADGQPAVEGAEARLEREGISLTRGRVPTTRIVDALRPVGLFTALREEQKRLAARVAERDEGGPVERIGGVDLAYADKTLYAAAATLDRRTLEPLEIAAVRGAADFPYVPTYLAYREFSGIQAAVRRLSRPPDVLLVDGHGRLHPALFGVACFVGVRLELPSIGVAKHPLEGRVETKSHRSRDAQPVRIAGKIRGYAWRPPGRARPIFISVGNRISLERALTIVQETTRHGYPEPLKVADRVSKEMKRNEKREKGAKQ